jgi:hypothetical protein
MSKYTDHLWQDLLREYGPTLAHAGRPEPSRARVFRRPGVLAGSALGLAGVGVAFILAAGGGTPAYAVTTNDNGSVLVTLNQTSALPQANAKLTSMGTHEQISVQMAPGAAAVNGPVECTSSTPGASVPGPPVKVLVGTDGTQVIASGNTGAGTWHLAACYVHNAGNTGSANTGNSGNTGNG